MTPFLYPALLVVDGCIFVYLGHRIADMVGVVTLGVGSVAVMTGIVWYISLRVFTQLTPTTTRRNVHSV